MAVKRAPIIQAYQLNLYCDKCGKIMTYTKTTYDPLTFNYSCECGHTETSTTAYPCQQVLFDTGKLEEVEI